jgi:uncharacterized protein (TIGR02757 family)
MEPRSPDKLRQILESLYMRYNRPECIDPDPLGFVRRYRQPCDREIAGLLSALMAYGRVRQIHKSLSMLLEILGPRPAQSVRSLNTSIKYQMRPFKHRFNTGADIVELLEIVSGWLNQHGSIEAVFSDGIRPDDTNVLKPLSRFYARFWQDYHQRFKHQPGPGMKFLLSSPQSSAKRMHLFLRWMVRRDAVDPGVWTQVSPRQLLVPVDTHILRLTRILGFHASKTATLKTVVRITEAFRTICPEDPVRYDFALSRIGILENCTGNIRSECRECELIFYCKTQK